MFNNRPRLHGPGGLFFLRISFQFEKILQNARIFDPFILFRTLFRPVSKAKYYMIVTTFRHMEFWHGIWRKPEQRSKIGTKEIKKYMKNKRA
jgi:hypothetical protein